MSWNSKFHNLSFPRKRKHEQKVCQGCLIIFDSGGLLCATSNNVETHRRQPLRPSAPRPVKTCPGTAVIERNVLLKENSTLPRWLGRIFCSMGSWRRELSCPPQHPRLPLHLYGSSAAIEHGEGNPYPEPLCLALCFGLAINTSLVSGAYRPAWTLEPPGRDAHAEPLSCPL